VATYVSFVFEAAGFRAVVFLEAAGLRAVVLVVVFLAVDFAVVFLAVDFAVVFLAVDFAVVFLAAVFRAAGFSSGSASVSRLSRRGGSGAGAGVGSPSHTGRIPMVQTSGLCA
jgi:hypothetical protein